MYAVVQTGGKQYKAEVGQVLTVEKLDVPEGDAVRFDQVLLLNDGQTVSVGTPLVEGASVLGTVVRQDRGPKIIVFKYKPKVRYRRKTGHRQYQTQVLVEAIDGPGGTLERRRTAAIPEAQPAIATEPELLAPEPAVADEAELEAPAVAAPEDIEAEEAAFEARQPAVAGESEVEAPEALAENGQERVD